MITVTCNGCFDGLHAGHYFFLGYCAAQGDRLVVGINPDEYIVRRKRPVPVPLDERIRALLGTGVVYDVVTFYEEEPSCFIRGIRPDVHCISEEYKGAAVETGVCGEVGAKIVYVPRVKGWSSTLVRGGHERKKA